MYALFNAQVARIITTQPGRHYLFIGIYIYIPMLTIQYEPVPFIHITVQNTITCTGQLLPPSVHLLIMMLTIVQETKTSLEAINVVYSPIYNMTNFR